ncbi:transposase [Deinococcus aquatilis]|uniref:transposase n=1 Tax=Deinococcus aquatilis TaxID=519440 RepID=UPI00248127DC|nr:transposase [Deinococcus aquatilis]
MSGYRKRFRIECLFRALKSKGFKLESTDMTLHDHVERLLCLLTLAYVWCVLVGIFQACATKAHGRRAWSIVTLGLRTLVRTFARSLEHGKAEVLDLIGLLTPSQTLNSESVCMSTIR